MEIYQDVLDRLSDAALYGDTRVLHDYIRLPFTFSTEMHTFTLTTEAELDAYCLSFTETLQAMGATDYIRIAREAHYVTRDRIEGFHYSHTIRNGHRLFAPFCSRHVVERGPERWQVTRAAVAIANDHWEIRMPATTPFSEFPPAFLEPQGLTQ